MGNRRAAAKAAAIAAKGVNEVVSGSGGMVNGEAAYAATGGPLMSMPETVELSTC